MPFELKILFVDDIPGDVKLAKQTLRKGGIVFSSKVVKDESSFCNAIAEYPPDIVISDYTMPQFSGMQALILLLEKSPATPFILLTGSANEETAVDFLKNGAADYILKEHITRLPLAVMDAIEKNKIILEKEKVKLDLIKSEERYRSLYENINIGLYRSTPKGEVLLANTALIKMLGYSSFKELEDLDLQKEGYARSYDRIKFINKIEKQGEVIGLESEWIKKDGTTIHIIENAKAIRDADGKTLYYDGTVENITERKNSENALRKSKTDLLEAQRVGRIGSWDWDAITDAITWSEEYYHIYGFDPKLKPPGYIEHLKVYTPESAQRLDMAVKESMKTGEGYQVDLELGSPLNTTRWVTARGEVIYDKERKIIGLRGTAQDITVRKSSEESLLKLKKAVDNSGEIIFLTDKEGIFTFVNPAFTLNYGFTADEIIGKVTPRILKSGVEDANYYKLFWETLKGGKEKRGELVNKRKDGTLINVEVSATPILDYANNIIGFLGIQRDISERKLSEQKTNAYITFLENLEKIDKAIEGETEIESMLENLVNTTFSIFDCDRAWLFYPCDPEAPSFKVPVEINKPEYPGANAKDIEIPMSPDLAENLREALASLEVVAYVDGTPKPINRITAEIFGVKSQMFIPIYPKIGPPWVFGLHQCSHARVWTTEEKQLFKEISKRAADNLTSLLVLNDLKESEKNKSELLAKLNESQHLGQVGSWELDLLSQHVWWSDESYRISDVTQEEFTPTLESLKTLVHPADLAHFIKVFETSLETNAEFDLDARLICKNSIVKHCHWKGKIIFDEVGKANRFAGTIIDITERKKAEESLSNEHLLLRTLIDNIPDAIYSKDLSCKKTLANLAEVCNVGAKSEAELLGKDDFDFYPKEIADGFFADDQSVLITGEPVINREEYILDENGEKRWLLSSKLPLRDKDDKIIGLVGIGRDITKRKQVEESLKEREEYYRFIVETTNSVMYRLNYASMKYEHLDESIKNLIGYTPEEINEIGFKNLIIKISKYHVEKINVDILIDERKQGKTLEWRADYLVKAKDGKLVWLADHSFPLTNESGAIFGSFGVLRDITESKNAEQDLLQAKERAEEMNRLKSNFLANMSHELRTPLNGILGYAEILTSMLDNPEQIEMIEGIYQSGKRLSETLKFILDLSDAETDKIEVVSKTIEVIQAVKNSINSFIPEAAKKNILLETIVKGENLYGSLDENLFMRVIYNLVDNALKFTKKGKISVEIGPEVIDAKEWFYVKIKDTGIGIPSDKIDLIWEEFRQVSEGLTRSFEGPGLGLTISKKAVNLMHGQISVESELGTGSTFTIKFPAVSAFPQKGEISEEKPIDKLQKIKVDDKKTDLPLALYVEDDFANRHIVKLFLKNVCDLETAEEGETALKLAAEKKYEIILMDINLGGEMNGMEVVKEILKMPQYIHTPIIAVTAYAMDKDKDEFLKSGFTHYISKPFKKDEIVNLVNSATENRQ